MSVATCVSPIAPAVVAPKTRLSVVVCCILPYVTASFAIMSVATCVSPIVPTVVAPKTRLAVVVCCILAYVTASSSILAVVIEPSAILLLVVVDSSVNSLLELSQVSTLPLSLLLGVPIFTSFRLLREISISAVPSND